MFQYKTREFHALVDCDVHSGFCKVLPHWQVHMHDVIPCVACWTIGWTSRKYAIGQRILACYIALNGLCTLSGDIFLSGGMLIQMISRRVIMIVYGKPQMTFRLTQYVPMLSTAQQPLVSLSPPLFYFWSCRVSQKKKSIKGSVERSLLPWAIFLIFTRNRPWKSEDHLWALLFIEMSKERLEKSERIPPVSWRHWALAYSRDRPYNFSCLSAVSKNGRFRSFFSASGVIWRGKAFRDQQCQFLTRNKSLSSENESTPSMTSECVRTDSILPRGAGLEHGRCKQSIFSLSIFDILVERLSF